MRPVAAPVEVDAAAWQVRPGGDIQAALEQAAADPVRKKVQVHAGTYRPDVPGQAFVWFNERHDGITLEAVGRCCATAVTAEALSIDDDVGALRPGLAADMAAFRGDPARNMRDLDIADSVIQAGRLMKLHGRALV